MKRFIILLILIIYLFSFVVHNSIMVFSSNQDFSDHEITKHSIYPKSEKTNDDNGYPYCSLIIDFDQSIKYNYEDILKNLIIKIDLNIITFSYTPRRDNSYLKINSPPYLNKDIKNYSYIELIKIIKSNT